jgi:actin-like ATPase involved in cell morphogenesis
MSDEQKSSTEPVVKAKQKNIVSVGLDVGTMNLCCARSDTEEIKITRNVFLSVDKELVNLSQLSKISYVEGEEGQIFIIGSDAFEFANLFGKEVSRPMEKGLISPKEIAAIDVLTLMLKDLIGDIKDRDVYCSYSVPAEAIDEGRSITYHENVFARILNKLGVNYKSVNEAMAIIYSECAAEQFSGIAISFGAGMSNCVLSYRGIEAHKFSTARSGDWIDQRVAESLAMVPNRVTNIKEKYMKFHGEVDVKNKKTQRVLEALFYYYKELIEYTVKRIIKEFQSKVDVEVEEKLPIVISGGTSMPEGFDNMFRSVLANYELPFEISEVRRAKNPLTAVANGLLVKTMADVKSMRK